MTLYTYTGSVTDVLKSPLTGWLPEMTVRPKVAAFSLDGLVSDIRVPVAVDATNGTFSFQAIPSGELTPVGGGPAGVDYIIEVGRYELADDLTKIWHGTEAWQFTAVAGGGNIGDMKGGSTLAVWFGPPWPSEPLPKGLYIDTTDDNDWMVVS